jgi:hypothetical protein
MIEGYFLYVNETGGEDSENNFNTYHLRIDIAVVPIPDYAE